MAKLEARAIMPHLLTAAVRRKVNALTLAAEEARCVRASDTVNAIADRLLEVVPYRLSAVAHYYKAIALNNQCAGSKESTTAFSILSGSGLPIIRARANLALGSQAFVAGDYTRALKWYEAAAETINFRTDPIGGLHLGNMQAATHGQMGNHELAASELRQLLSIAKVTKANLSPLVYNLWNSLANELLQSGKITAARGISDNVIASPFISAYPEWVETHEDIQRAAHESKSVTVPGQMATIHSMKDYRASRGHEDFLGSAMGRLYVHSQNVPAEIRHFLDQSVEVLIFHAIQNARPPTR